MNVSFPQVHAVTLDEEIFKSYHWYKLSYFKLGDIKLVFLGESAADQRH